MKKNLLTSKGSKTIKSLVQMIKKAINSKIN